MNREQAQRVMDNMRCKSMAHTVQNSIDDMQRVAEIAHDMGLHDLEGQVRAARAGLLAVAKHEAIERYTAPNADEMFVIAQVVGR